jgi:protease-4
MRAVSRFFGFAWLALDGLRKALHLLLLLLLFGVVLFALVPKTPVVPHTAALVIAPQGTIVEQLSGNPLDRAFAQASGNEKPESLLRDIVDAIKAAKTDSRIPAVVLDLKDVSGGGIAKFEELALAIRDFRTSGKPVIATGEMYDQLQYYLAANADEIYLDPEGMVYIDGFGYYRNFLKDAVDKLSVDVNIFKAGKFKSYTDQFSRSSMSDQEREETSVWLNSLWSSYQASVTQARGMPTTAITEYVEQMLPALRKAGGDLSKVALERGLVTDLKTRDQVEQRLIALTGEDEDHSFRGIDYLDYVHAERPRHMFKDGDKRIGVVVAEGEIVDGDQPPGTIGGDSTADLLRQARFDKDIKAVVLRIDSPGGSVLASEVIRRELDALKQAGKPVVASMSSTAASGGYYIAMDADEIWASPVTITGSIGVFTVFPTFERTLDKVGVKTDGIGTTSLSGAIRLDRTLTDGPKEILQLTVDHEYKQFVEHVAQARNKPFDVIDGIAQGRVWSGADAHTRGLVDQLGSFQDALAAAAKRAKLGKDYKVDYIEPPLTWRQLLAGEVNTFAARIVRGLVPQADLLQNVERMFTPVQAELARLSHFTDPRKAYYYCVCTVE